MTIRNTYAAESWDTVYNAFQQVNFTSYDFDTVKASLLQYLRIYYPEAFNDFIESSELIALLELFAYSAELIAYRVDINSHENFITTAQRKQSILKLAKLISYKASRNMPGRGLVKIDSVMTTEEILDANGNSLSNVVINWNDATNSSWKDQFFAVMNSVMSSKFGLPSKIVQVNDVTLSSYTLRNDVGGFRNGVYSFLTNTQDSVSMEIVAADLDSNGAFERDPDPSSQFSVLYSADGKGYGSDFTGFLAYVKQGTLSRLDFTISEEVANRRIEFDQINVNNTDVWLYQTDSSGVILNKWTPVSSVTEQNLYFNDILDTKKKFEIESLENDKIALIFGDGNLAEIPLGNFQLWTRVSENRTVNIPKSSVSDQTFTFTYENAQGLSHTCVMTVSLTGAIQNNAPSESIEHIRQSAPATYYSQDRMINGKDYNTYPLRDTSILRVKTINRTFAGQPKHVNWSDASKKYENVKLFGDDLIMYQDMGLKEVVTTDSTQALVDAYIEPLLQSNAWINAHAHILATTVLDSEMLATYSSKQNVVLDATTQSIKIDHRVFLSSGIITYPRRSFIEDATPNKYFNIDGTAVTPFKIDDGTYPGSLREKTAIQLALDGHYYGEPLSTETVNGISYAIMKYAENDTSGGDDGFIYNYKLPRGWYDSNGIFQPYSGVTPDPNTQMPSGFGLKFNRFLQSLGNGSITLDADFPCVGLTGYENVNEVFTIEMLSDKSTFSIISNLRGKLPSYSLTSTTSWSTQNSDSTDAFPFDFTISQGSVVFEQGDAFVVDLIYSHTKSAWEASLRELATGVTKANLNGWWQVVDIEKDTTKYPAGGLPSIQAQLSFDADSTNDSWVFLVYQNIDSSSDKRIMMRDLKTIAESPTTNFWYNQTTQILDSETKKPLFDKIRILRSNRDKNGHALKKSHIYDVVDFAYDLNGVITTTALEVMPTDCSTFDQYGDTVPDNILQYETFVEESWQYGILESDNTVTWLDCCSYRIINGYDLLQYDSVTYDTPVVFYDGLFYYFPTATHIGSLWTEDDVYRDYYGMTYNTYRSSNTISQVTMVRRPCVPAPISPLDDENSASACSVTNTGEYVCNTTTGLDFMWQHFSPHTNLIDPSPSNIHDMYIMTNGYYHSLMNYVRGLSSIKPTEPTPYELRSSYSYLLKNKATSDTVILHSGKVKLLFGALADQKLRAKFKVVKSASSTFSDEKIKSEVISVINEYFDISNWDFGETFFATELMSLIHQRLAAQIASVVIVPTYSSNSFGSLFTIESGMDEILQSAATVNDVEIVSALTSSVIRQIK